MSQLSHPPPTEAVETLEEFKNSFSYGSRSDLTFKFLKSLTSQEAGEFFTHLLWEIGHSLDDGRVAGIHDVVIDWQRRAYAASGSKYRYDDAPFTRPTKPIAESRVGVLTSSGHFAADDDPEPFGVAGMTQEEAERRISEFMRETPVLSTIPTDIAGDDLRVRHGGYDIRSADHDPDVALPLRTMRALQREGRIGTFGSPMYSFTGATSQGRLRSDALPVWIDRVRADAIDVLLLVPV